MLGPLGGDAIKMPLMLEKSRKEAQALANSLGKSPEEGGVIYGYKYTMNNGDYGFKGDDIKFLTVSEIKTWENNGQVAEVYIAYKED